MQDGVAVDASLTPTSRGFFERVAAEIRSDPMGLAGTHADTQSTETSPVLASGHDADRQADGNDRNMYETVEVPLVFDAEFFDMLQSDVNNLDALQTEEEGKMTAEVVELGKEVSFVCRTSRFSKSDLARWRRIFELYLDAEVFFSTHERDHGTRSSQMALKQLQLFQAEVEKGHLARNFKLRESRMAFSRFVNLNLSLLKNLQFQELNKLAIVKILKSECLGTSTYATHTGRVAKIPVEFDKRTSLGVSQTFRSAIQSESFLSRDMAKDICAQMSQQLVTVVPQLNDYLCPVCFSVAYRPVRLDCGHVFCIRCVVKIQRRNERHCPLCRADVVMNASAGKTAPSCVFRQTFSNSIVSPDNLDRVLEKYMKQYFAKEVKEKQRANEIERGIEDYGPGYTHHDCVVL